MNIKLFFKKLFDLSPTVGDRVCGHICYGSTFSGTIVKDNSKSMFSHYVVNGSTVYYKETGIKPSEGSVQCIQLRWTLSEWLHGSDNQDSYPYLMGWVNSIKSAMAYTNRKTLK